MSINWVNLIKENEDLALNKLYATYREESVHWLMQSFHIDKPAALDIFQLSVVQFYQNIISEKLVKLTNPKSYFFSICKNKAHEYKKYLSKSRLTTNSNHNFASIIDHSDHDIEERKILESNIEKMEIALKKLEEPCYTVLKSYYFKKIN